MTFTSSQLATIRKIAEKYGVQEMEATEQKGIFLDAKTRIIINCKVTSKEKEFKGLPEIGITDMKGFTDENAGGQTVDDIRDDIRSALKALPREKSKPKVEHDSAKQGNSYIAPKPEEVKKDEDIPETKKADPIPEKVQEVKPHEPTSIKDAIEKDRKDHESKAEEAQAVSPPAPKVQEPEPKKTVPVIMCSDCGFEISHADALKQAEDGIRPKDMKHADCGEKKEGTMNEQSPKEPEKQPELKPTENILEYIRTYVNNDVLEIFGDSGTGKSKFAVEVARQTILAGKTVFYLDTERNLSKEEVEKLKGCQYKYTPLISEISSLTRTLPKVDLVIIDSIGFPILTAYARMNMKQKGDALLNMIAIFGDLKEWAYRNNSIAIVINQPESDFNKEPGHLIRPFGDKSQFAAKEIWKTDVTQRGAVTKSTVQAFRSRSVGHKTLIASMEVSNNGTVIKGVKGNGT